MFVSALSVSGAIFLQREARMTVRRRAAGGILNYLPVVPVSLISHSRRSGASQRTRFVALAAIFYLAILPTGVAAEGTTTALAEFVPPLSFGVSRLDDTGLRNVSTISSPENAERRSFSTGEVLDPIPKTSSMTFQPTYVRRTDGTYQAYVQLKPVIVVESGLPLLTRIEWPVPEVDNENGPTNAGIGDLTWLTLLVLGSSKAWGTLGMGPVLVFPTASHSEMGDGKYQIGPALGYINRAVPGWQFAFLLQQYFSFAGDSERSRVNQLTLQPFVTKLLPDAWYVQTQPIITLDFVKSTSSVPVNLVVGKLFAGRWNVSLQATGYPPWTSPPSKQYELRLSIGYQFPAFFSKP